MDPSSSWQVDFFAAGAAVDLPFSSFVPSWRGRVLEGQVLDTQRIVSVGFMLSKLTDLGFPNPQAPPGKFSLEVSSLQFY
jgi:hypothetical protein